MSADGFRSLSVYRKASRLANELHEAVLLWPSFAKRTAGYQLVRAADSVGANIAEAYGRRTDPDRLRILWMARGSVCELQHWIATAQERALALPEGSANRADELGRMLNGLTRAWGRRPSD